MLWKWLRKFWKWLCDLFKSDPSGSFKATLTRTGQSLTVDQFVDLGSTPGNVAICLSGGGSRALSAGMGQLRALKHLTTNPGGPSLLDQAKVISTVSGGSWLGVGFVYLTPGTTDDDYLNRYVADPGRLVPDRTDGHSLAETLDELPEGNIGEPVAARSFSPVSLGIQMLLLHRFGEVPPSFLWQTAIGLHILRPYDLYDPGRDFVPTTFFTYDAQTRDVILSANPRLEAEAAQLVAAGASRVRRPFLICNTSMFVKQEHERFQLLAPVEATSFMTGIVGHPEGTDANGKRPGGGGVTSFAFSSNPTAVDGDDVTVTQERQLALMDIVGASSAFFAEALENLLAGWRQDPEEFFRELEASHEEHMEWCDEVMPRPVLDKVKGFIDRQLLDKLKEKHEERHGFVQDILDDLDAIREVIPEYRYWPVRDAAPAERTEPTRFADGGNLENVGLADALSFDDVDNVLAMVNSPTPMVAAAKGVIDADGNEVPGTRVEIDSQVSALFGYQPYNSKKGYLLYEGAEDPESPEMMHSKVFPPEAFPELLKGFWAAAGNTGDPADLGVTGKKGKPGVDLKPVILKQELVLQDNCWFRVTGGRKVGVVWFYLNRVKEWYDLLRPEVQEILGPFDDPDSFLGFPNYSTFRTHLTATQLNLLAHLTAWSVGNSPEYRELFK